MALIGVNGGLVGSRRIANVGAASGIWTANEQVVLKRAGSWSVVSDTNAAAYIAAVEAADGQILEDGVKTAINSFVVGCKADGIWTAIKASCILAGARTLAGALVPLVGTAPTNNNFVSGDYNRETGLVGNGSTKSLDSNRANNADPQNSKHIATFVSTASSATDYMVYLGASVGTAGGSLIQLGGSGNGTNADLLGVANGMTPALVTNQGRTTGFKGVNRSSSASVIVRSSSTSNSYNQTSGTASDNIAIYATKYPEFIAYSDGRLAFYSIGESLNLALLDTRVTTLINDIAAAIP